jgi:hypothetical protein
MKKELILQGRQVTSQDVELIKQLMAENPDWNRTKLSRQLCLKWKWSKPCGQLKDMACRSFLRKLEKLGYIQLPPALVSGINDYRNRHIESVLHNKETINGPIKQLYPIGVKLVEKENEYDLKLFKYFIFEYHYLGWSGTVGENLKYLFSDGQERPLGCMMFGAAAWKVEPRDSYIGWSQEQRTCNLYLIANNNRFLLLPWVGVKHLASHILGRICKRISRDWQGKYNHPVYFLETFVEKNRFSGTCYKAANWIYLGETKGRGKLDVKKEYSLPVKRIFVYPLVRGFRDKMINA